MKKIISLHSVVGGVLLCLVAASVVFAGKVNLEPARTALQEGRYREAVDLLVELEKSDRRNNELYRLLGDAYTGLDDIANAEKAYGRAVQLKSGDIDARLKWGDALVALGNTGEAIKVLEKGLKGARKDPQKAAFNDGIGRALVAAGNCTGAQEYLLRATIQDDANIMYHLHLGDAYFDCQVYSLARIEYQTVLGADSGYCLAWYRIGVAQFRDRAFQDALVAFGNAYLCDTTYVPVYYDLALLYVLSARSVSGEKAATYYQSALYYFERYRAAWPDSNKVLVAKNVSLAYYYLRDYEKAAEELSRAIDIGVDDPELLFLLGRSLQLLKRYDEAIVRFDEYETVLADTDTASAEFYNRRATCRVKLAEQDSARGVDADWQAKAVADYQQAIALDSNDVRALSMTATLLNGKVLRRYEESIWYFDRMTQLFPGEARYWFNAALPRLKLERESEALEFLFQAMEIDTTAEGKVRGTAQEIISPILLKSGRYREARDFYKKLVAQDPNNCDNLQWYAFTFHVAEQYQQALPHLERAYNCMKRKGRKPCQMRDIMLWVAQAYSQIPRMDKVKPLVEAGLKCDPNDPDLLKLKKIYEESEEIQYIPGTKAGGN